MGNIANLKNILENNGIEFTPITLSKTTRTAKDAAEAIGCTVSEIAKSIIFRGIDTGKPYLVIASGANRINEASVIEQIGEPIEKANADFVKKNTGFVIGGVPPFGHCKSIETYIDEDILIFQEIWAAAGTPYSVFKLTPLVLVRISNGKVITIK